MKNTKHDSLIPTGSRIVVRDDGGFGAQDAVFFGNWKLEIGNYIWNKLFIFRLVVLQGETSLDL